MTIVKAQGLEHELKQTKDLVDSLKQKQAEWNARSAQLLSKHNVSGGKDDHWMVVTFV
jgi:sulfur relay (sulfurtransferase) DsrC/TusE family protein